MGEQMALFDIDRFEPEGDSMVRRMTGRSSGRVPLGVDSWNWTVPLVFQSLASPQHARYPRYPGGEPSLDTSEGVLGYWAGLQAHLTYVLGWMRHDRGLRWWLENDKPTDDPRLALLEELWEADGAVEPYLYWIQELPGFRNPTAFWPEQGLPVESELSALWAQWQRLHRERVRGRMHPPFGLHLEDGMHIRNLGPTEPVEVGDMTPRITANPSTAIAVLEAQTIAQAFTALTTLGGALPPTSSQHAWRVKVYARTTGYLGSYRHSWATDRWFAGPHRIHMHGS